MSALNVYYDGRHIGQLHHWLQDGRQLTIEDDPIGLLQGMVIDLVLSDRDRSSQRRVGALVAHASASSVLIRLDDSAAFGTQ